MRKYSGMKYAIPLWFARLLPERASQPGFIRQTVDVRLWYCHTQRTPRSTSASLEGLHRPYLMFNRTGDFLRAVVIAAVLVAAPIASRAGETAWQYSTIAVLTSGGYNGDLTAGELKTHGDFGLGTFNALNGEMIVSLRGRPPFRDSWNDRGLGLWISGGDGKCPQVRLWAQVCGSSVGTGRGQRS